MLAAKGMLESLHGGNSESHCKDRNDDHDFGKVLEFCGSGADEVHKVRYFDGQEASFSFDD